MYYEKHLTVLALLVAFTSGHRDPSSKFQNDPICNVSSDLIAEIQGYQPIADLIIDTILNGDWKGRTYDQLAKFVDLHPVRLTGGYGLEKAIDYMIEKMKTDGLENWWTQDVQVPHWIRGEEKAEIVSPTFKKMNILGLGPSVGTPSEGFTAPIIVVHNFTELDLMSHLVPGKIVVYATGWQGSYGATNMYRGRGAIPAAEYGALAVLVESVTPYSLDTPHTGGTQYSDNVTKIPIASITREDAQLLDRLYQRGEIVEVHLKMEDELLEEPARSRNTFAEITGSEIPDEIVAVSGHIDAWDVGQGAQDDAGGVMISVEALAVIKHLGLRPRRTMQAILWTGEEQFLVGAEAFVERFGRFFEDYKAVFESDTGTFTPKGLDFAGSPEAGCVIQEILKLVQNLNASEYARYPIVGSDIMMMTEEGVPGLSLNNEDDKYFYYHHSPADTMMSYGEDGNELDLCTAVWAVTSFVLADLSETLPRTK